jgi:hypothetical protein
VHWKDQKKKGTTNLNTAPCSRYAFWMSIYRPSWLFWLKFVCVSLFFRVKKCQCIQCNRQGMPLPIHQSSRFIIEVTCNELQSLSTKSIYVTIALCWALAALSLFYLIDNRQDSSDGESACPAHRTTQTQNKCTQRSMPQVGFEPTMLVLQRTKTVHALDREVTVIGSR